MPEPPAKSKFSRERLCACGRLAVEAAGSSRPAEGFSVLEYVFRGDLEETRVRCQILEFFRPKDVAAALNWYRQSATNGYAEAGMTLGNFYSDGLEAKPDYVEAFVWYGVAAGQGNRLAEVFRNGMRRKLDAGQLAEAEKRVAAILTHRPPNATVSEPASSGNTN